MNKIITMDELNRSFKKSRLNIALSRDEAKAKWMNVWCSVRMKYDKNPEQAEILAQMWKARFDKLFTYLWVKNWIRTYRLNQNN